MPKVAHNSAVQEIGAPMPRGVRRHDKSTGAETFEQVLRQSRANPQPPAEQQPAGVSGDGPVEPQREGGEPVRPTTGNSPAREHPEAEGNAESAPQQTPPPPQPSAQPDAALNAPPTPPQIEHDEQVKPAPDAPATEQSGAWLAAIWPAGNWPPPAAAIGEQAPQPQQDDGLAETASPVPAAPVVVAAVMEANPVAVAMADSQPAQDGEQSPSDHAPPGAAMKLPATHAASISNTAAPQQSQDAQQAEGIEQRPAMSLHSRQDSDAQKQAEADADSHAPTQANPRTSRPDALISASRTLETADRSVPSSIVETPSSGQSLRPVPLQPAPSSVAQAPARPEADFVATNHDRIVTSIRGELMPNGGTMRIRLDPPELGTLQVTVRMLDGVMSASFETSSDQATKLLSHSLGQLRQVLESQGLSVEKLHVQQSPREQPGSGGGDAQHQQPSHEDRQWTRQEQQRREMLRRMWRRLGLAGTDPLDLVA